MLQQTRVETAILYYRRFLRRFPTMASLARAPLQDVLKQWENMGYYARARHLHEAARRVMGEMGGRIPDTWDQLVSLPGIGTYTASAILSVAFGKRFPALDGNVRRVLCRLFCIQKPLDRPGTEKRLFTVAAELVPPIEPGIYNQAMMDLGAEVCTPRDPSCGRCPLVDLCLSRRKGVEKTLPIKKKRNPLPLRRMTSAVVADEGGRLLIVRRPAEGLLGGLWKFPGGEVMPGENPEVAVEKRVFQEVGLGIKVEESIVTVKHVYTHFRMILHAFRAIRQNGEPDALLCADWRWVEFTALDGFPFSKADRKVIDAL